MVVKRGPAAVLAMLDAAALIALYPDLGSLATHLAAAHSWLARVGPDRALVQVGSAALWLSAVWLGIGLVAASAGAVPGRTGRFATALARAALPRVLQRVVAGSAGLGVLLAPAVASARPVAPAVPSAVSAAAQLRPAAEPARQPATDAAAPHGPAAPTPAWPTAPRHHRPTGARHDPPSTPRWPQAPAPPATHGGAPAPDPGRPTGHAEPDRVRVHAGDCLWMLAAQRLGPRVSLRDIERYWPRWYAANKTVIGDDPDLITPGEVLRIPAPSLQEPS